MNLHYSIKIIAASVCAAVSVHASAGLGGLQVQSGLGEPFSGSIVVTGAEAQVLLNQGKPVISGTSALRASVTQQGENAVIRLRSAQPIQEPLLSFGLTVGVQGRQYNAIIDPPNYRARSATAPKESTVLVTDAAARSEAARAAVAAALAQEPGAEKGEEKVRSNAAAPVFSGQNYRVAPQENLIDVARKVQPQGLTLAQTMRALVRANPRAFRHGNPDLMYKGVTLRIPTAAQMQRLARRGAPDIQAKVPATAESKTAAETTAGSVAASAAAVVVASAPVAASEPAPVTAAASMAVASETTAVSAPVPASAPVAAPKIVPEAPAEPAPEASWLENSYIYVLGALGIVLLLAALLWQRRRRPEAEAQTSASEPSVSGALVGQAYAVEASEDNGDDDVVFVDVEQNIRVVETPAQNTVETVPASGADSVTDKPDTEDWSWLGDEASSSDAQGVAVAEFSEAATKNDWPGKQILNVAPEAEEAVVMADNPDDDEDWLQFDSATIQTEPEPTAEAPADDDVWAWSAEDATGGTGGDATAAFAAAADSETEDDFEWLVEPVVPTESEAAETASDDGALIWDDNALTEVNNLAQAHKGIEPAADAQQRQAFAATSEDLAVVDLDWDALDGAEAREDKGEVTIKTASPPSPLLIAEAAPLADAAASGEVTAANLAVPLEAKLELARMYLEIDDAKTARETLQDLVAEADGDILAEAQSLLRQLGD